MLFTTIADDAALGIAALALTSCVLLLLIVINASVARGWKIACVVVVFTALTAAWQSMIGILGLPTSAPLPARYAVLATRVVEPDPRAGEPGVVLLWIEAADAGRLPRAHAVPYTQELHRRIITLTQAAGRHERLHGRGKSAGGIELYLHAGRPAPKPVNTR